MNFPDVAHWKELSPLLDGLLDLGPHERAMRLATLRLQDPTLADELASLVIDAERSEKARFLAGRVPHTLTGGDGVAATASLAGERIGAYLLEAPLGAGGTGAVWRARRVDGRFEGEVAVKLLHLSLVGRTGALRFEREGAILARLSHPNIARLLDAGVTAGGQPYIVLELVDGERIDRHCDAHHLNVGERVALFERVLDAVSHAHRHLVIHRDIKPNNILVGREGEVKLLDFGIAKLIEESAEEGAANDLTGQGGQALTPDYAAPEQLRGEPITTATDVYSLGVLLYQLLTGRHPTVPAHATPADIVRATLDTDPGRLSSAVTQGRLETDDGTRVEHVAADRSTSPSKLRRQLGGDLETIVAKALRKLPGDRYPSIDAFSEDLRRWQAGEPVSARPATLAYRTSRFVKRHRGAVAAAGLTFVAIVAGLVGTISQAHRAQLATERALHETDIARQERDGALEQQRLQRGTNEFLAMLMRDAAGGDPDAIRKQLDRSRLLIDQTRFEKPIVKIALMRQVAGRYMEIGDIDTGVQMLRDTVAALKGTDLETPASAVPVNLACSLGRALIEANDPVAGLAELDRADRLLAAGAQVSVPSRVDCKTHRVAGEISMGQFERGLSGQRAALAELEQAGLRDGEQHRVLVSRLAWALGEAGQAKEALALARPVLAESEAAQGRNSIAVLRRSAIVTSILRIGGDPKAALDHSLLDRETARAILGGRDDAAIELEQGRILVALARYADADEVLAKALQAAAAGSAARLWLGLADTEALIGAGRLDDAQRRLDALKPQRDALTGDVRPERIDGLRIEALLAAARGDTDNARRLVAAAQALVDRAGGVAHPMAFAVAMARARIDPPTSASASSTGASAVASGASTASTAGMPLVDLALATAQRRAIAPDRSSDVGLALLLRARSRAAASRFDDARRDAALALPMLEATLGSAHPATRAADSLAHASGS